MEVIFTWEGMIALLTLTGLEIVLGIDNIVVLSILVEKLPAASQAKARRIGLTLALVARLLLLMMVSWLTKLTHPIFESGSISISIRDLVLIVGGLFLMAKATTEIFHTVEMKEDAKTDIHEKAGKVFFSVLLQIVIFDIIFSLDSVLTAVGLSNEIYIMSVAVILSIGFMMVFANAIGSFVSHNPGIKILALAFLVLIGMLLMAEGFGTHFNRGYVYFAMVFSLFIELLNRRRSQKLERKKNL